MKITDDRARDLLRWLDDMAGDHTLYRDAAALIRQLQAAEQSAWHAGLDAGRELGRSKDHAHQPPSVPVGVAEAWQQGYHQGVEDERTSEANIGIAGFGAKVEPARVNPYLAQQPAAVEAHELWAAAHAGCRRPGEPDSPDAAQRGSLERTQPHLFRDCRGNGIAVGPRGCTVCRLTLEVTG